MSMRNATIQTIRRWTVYECPDHGLTGEIHVFGDMQCPVFVKGIGCKHNLTGPIVVEEIPHASLMAQGYVAMRDEHQAAHADLKG